MPFEVAGERIARPFRDGWAWMSDLLDAKDENEKLRQENDEIRRELIEARTAVQELALQGQISTYISGPRFPADFDSVVARVVGRPPTPTSRRSSFPRGQATASSRTLRSCRQRATWSARSPT